MRVREKRLAVCLVGFCLPCLLVIAFWIYGLCQIPVKRGALPSTAGRHYRSIARELAKHPERADVTGRRAHGSGWLQKGSRLNGHAWGYEPAADGRMLVWYEDEPRQYRAVYVTSYQPAPYAPIIFYGGGALVLLFLSMAGFSTYQLVRYGRERDDFLAATAHDLATPLAGLRRLIGRNDAAARILCERLVRLVTNVNDFLRLGGDLAAPRCETFDLREAYQQAYAVFQDDFRSMFDGRDVPVEGPAEVPVCADETRTVQILWNLLCNDLKYAAPYGEVSVRFSLTEREAVVEVRDTGKGMLPVQMRRAFTRYYRAQNVLHSGKGGFGIGLCTSREFARAMGGNLSLAPNQPHGCVFTLRLPRR